MIKILFVCHGNICRSPMAEFVMKDMVEKKGMSHMFEISSCATSREELGNPVYPPVRRVLLKHNINCDGKFARQMTNDDYDYYNYIVAMDSYNLRNLARFVGDDEDGKVSLLLDHTDRPGNVSDPWPCGDFEKTWEDVTLGCEGLLNKLI